MLLKDDDSGQMWRKANSVLLGPPEVGGEDKQAEINHRSCSMLVDQCNPLRNVSRLNKILKLSRVWPLLFCMRYHALTAERVEIANCWKSGSWTPVFLEYLLLLSLGLICSESLSRRPQSWRSFLSSCSYTSFCTAQGHRLVRLIFR
jgi:hypothetical protein